jgi:hypothetical protein
MRLPKFLLAPPMRNDLDPYHVFELWGRANGFADLFDCAPEDVDRERLHEAIALYGGANVNAPRKAPEPPSELNELAEGLTFEIDDEIFEWNGFSLKDTVRAIETKLIMRALKDAGGVSKAALLLGYDHHQSLISKLRQPRFSVLRALGCPPRKRRKPLLNRRTPAESGQWEKPAL